MMNGRSKGKFHLFSQILRRAADCVHKQNGTSFPRSSFYSVVKFPPDENFLSCTFSARLSRIEFVSGNE